MKKLWAICLSLTLAATLFSSCGNNETTTPESSTGAVLTKLALSKNVTAYKTGDTVSLEDAVTVMFYDDGSESDGIAYRDLASHGLAAGLYLDGALYEKTTFEEGNYLLAVYAIDDTSIYATVEISATQTGEVYPTGVTVTRSVSLITGDASQLKITFEPSTVTVKSVTWSSSDPSVATVDENGMISAVSVGSAVITATAKAQDGTVSSACEVTVEAASAVSGAVKDQTGSFSLTTQNGAFTQSGNVYTISSGGSYVLAGNLTGRIVVNAGENDEVELHLAGVTITSDENSPVLVFEADSVKIVAEDGTENTLYDRRSAKTTDAAEQGEGVISAKCDLKLTGGGKLYVEGAYHNGVHTTKDLKISDLTLSVKAPGNAIKGKDSITIESGTLTAISTSGDGIETENTDLSSKGKQRGSITINGGTVTVYAAGDGVQAAYDFEMNGGSLSVYTASNSSFTDNNATVTSYKGVKVKNQLTINDGTVQVYSYDDALHADYGTKCESGATGVGIITINGGSVTTKVNSSASRYVSGADAIHADNALNITGGTVNIASAYEGLEANFIHVSGGDIVINASDDGMNAAKKINQTPAITVSGGKIDITMGSGDTDGIDSNGTFTMTGGLIIVRGAPNSNSSMATGLDCDGAAKITGGTFIQLGARETVPTLGSGCYTANFGSTSGGGFGGGFGGGPGGRGGFGGASSGSNPITGGTWTLSGLNITFTVASGSTYYGAVVYSSSLTKGTTYTLSNGTASYTATAE